MSNIHPELLALGDGEVRSRDVNFSNLRASIRRIEVMGTADDLHRSLHHTVVDGVDRQLYFRQGAFPRIGNITRIIVNDLTHNDGLALDESHIVITDYAIPSAYSYITRKVTEAWVHEWSEFNMVPQLGPRILTEQDQLKIIVGKEYNQSVWLPVPFISHEEAFEQADYSNELQQILSRLGLVTLKTEVNFGDPPPSALH